MLLLVFVVVCVWRCLCLLLFVVGLVFLVVVCVCCLCFLLRELFVVVYF